MKSSVRKDEIKDQKLDVVVEQFLLSCALCESKEK